MKVKDLLKVLYPHQRIRIVSCMSCLDTDVCLKQADKIRPFLNYNVFKISYSGDVLIIEVNEDE